MAKFCNIYGPINMRVNDQDIPYFLSAVVAANASDPAKLACVVRVSPDNTVGRYLSPKALLAADCPHLKIASLWKMFGSWSMVTGRIPPSTSV